MNERYDSNKRRDTLTYKLTDESVSLAKLFIESGMIIALQVIVL